MPSLLKERAGDRLNLIETPTPAFWEMVTKLFDCASHIMPLRWVDSYEAESTFED
jgi:hypothetical protein